MPKIKNTTTV